MKYKKPSLEEIRAEAAKYNKRSELKEANHRIYYVAMKGGLLDELYPTIGVYHRKWTPESLAEEAKKFATRSEFYKQSGSAYQSARNLGILDEVCSHMKRAPMSDYDVIYIAKALEFEDVYKVGVTSLRLNGSRIDQLELKCSYVVLAHIPTGANHLESRLLRIGNAVHSTKSSEYRHWTEEDRRKALQLVFENC